MSKKLKLMFTKNTDDWKTPKEIYENYMKHEYIDCFPYQANYDEFKKTYKNKKLFVNPPISKLKFIPEWIKRQLKNGCKVTLLIPARTDTKYFHELLDLYPQVVFIKGRLHYNESKSAPFPSIYMHFDKFTLYPDYQSSTWLK